MLRAFLVLVIALAYAPLLAISTAGAAPFWPKLITAADVNNADLRTLITPQPAGPPTPRWTPAGMQKAQPKAAMVRLQVLLDRTGASPGVIDGYDGDNVRKAIFAFETMAGFEPDGRLDKNVILALESDGPVIGTYTVTPEDVAAIVAPLPTDYAELAKRDFLGYTSVREQMGERFHMHVNLLSTLNPKASFVAGETLAVAAYGPDLNMRGKVARIEADKTMRQVRAYDAEDRLIAAYPATIGSPDNPSPSGVHIVEAVAANPTYTYNPKINFQQGNNTKVLTLPPGPNGPVGSMWIDLSEPTFGIHGTPEPSKIDKTGSHGCVRLTNWDANELAKMVKVGIPVVFIG
jgi:lipoprotein-anchoring transpeptidase ErfK/SrfK